MKRSSFLAAALALSLAVPAVAHDHAAPSGPDKMWAEMLARQQTLATSVAFDARGRLWRAGVQNRQVRVDRSDDGGRTFSTPVAVNPEPEIIGAEGDSNPKIAIGPRGEILISWTRLLELPFTGDVRFARSLDDGQSFSAPLTVNDNREVIGHRYDALTVGGDGKVYLAWLDKRDLAAAKKKGEKYAGSAVYYAVSADGGASFGPNRKLADHSCDCCRIALAAPAQGAPLALWRHDFAGEIRDHALARLDGRNVMQRVNRDGWKIEACPHHGPALAVGAGDMQHLAWFTGTPGASGLFYARSQDGEHFSAPLPFGDNARQPGHPALLAVGRTVYLAWKEFDGEVSSVQLMVSQDGGASWSTPRQIAATRNASDHPQLLARGAAAFLSWNSREEGYRLIALEAAP